MEFTANRNDLAQAVVSAAGGIPANPVIPVRAGLHIRVRGDNVTFTGSDGDVTFQASCAADVMSADDDTVVPGKLFADVVKSLPDGEVRITTAHASLTLRCGRSKFSFRTLDGYYPDPPEPAKECGTTDGTAFAEAIRKVSPASAKDASNPALTGVLIEAGENLDIICTDGYRLAAVTCTWIPGQWDTSSALVPSWAAERFARSISGNVSIGWDDRVCTLRSGDFTVITRLLTGNFPNWQKILPQQEPDVSVNAKDLAGAVKRAMLASENDSPVQLLFSEGELQIQAAGSSGQSIEIIPASYQGEGFSALFGGGKLADGLAACGETCMLGFTEPHKPVYIYSGAIRYMILPRRQV